MIQSLMMSLRNSRRPCAPLGRALSIDSHDPPGADTLDRPKSGKSRAGRAVALEMKAIGLTAGTTHPEARAEVVANQCTIAQLHLGPAMPALLRLEVASSCFDASGQLHLELKNMHPRSPKSLDVGPNERRLGICLETVKIDFVQASGQN